MLLIALARFPAARAAGEEKEAELVVEEAGELEMQNPAKQEDRKEPLRAGKWQGERRQARGHGKHPPPRKITQPVEKFEPRAASDSRFADVAEKGATNLFRPEWLQAPTNFFTLGPGDVIDIEVLGSAGRIPALVCLDGKIYYGLLPGLRVWGLTLGETQELLENEMFKLQKVPRPRVSVSVRTVASKRIWLLGRVHAPGIYPLAVPLTVLEAITMAGGPIMAGDTDLASLEDAFVMRDGQMLPVNLQQLLRKGDLSQNIYLQPDDFVYLPPSFVQEVYLLGAIRRSMVVPFREELTLVSAVAAAGGAQGGAALSHVTIIRGSLQDPKVAVVNLRDIQRGRATDVLLEPRDIIFIPRSPYPIIWSYIRGMINTFVRTVAINEGALAVVPNVEPVAPTIPIP